MRTKYYIGFNGRFWEAFGSDNSNEATPEASGYEKVEGPFDTIEEAEETANGNN